MGGGGGDGNHESKIKSSVTHNQINPITIVYHHWFVNLNFRSNPSTMAFLFLFFLSSSNLVHETTHKRSQVDDYYVLGGTSRLTVIETSNEVFNTSAYAYLTPESNMCWVRTMAANMIATNG